VIGLFFEVSPLEVHASRYFRTRGRAAAGLERTARSLFSLSATQSVCHRVDSGSRKETLQKQDLASIGLNVILSSPMVGDEEYLIRGAAHRAIVRSSGQARSHFRDSGFGAGRPRSSRAPQRLAASSCPITMRTGNACSAASLFKSVYRKKNISSCPSRACRAGHLGRAQASRSRATTRGMSARGLHSSIHRHAQNCG